VNKYVHNPEYFIEQNYTKEQKAQYDAYLKMAKIIKDKNYVKEYKTISIYDYISDEEFEYLHNLGPSIKAIKWVKDTYDDDLGVDELDA